jgi:competence protein ComFB
MAKSKKELDRDSMFQKIMPSLAENPYAVGNQGPAAPNAAASGGGSIPPIEELPGDDSLSALRDKLFARSGDSCAPDSVATINLMESLVLQNIDAVIQKFSCCSCDRCRRDIAAYALNQLPPKYIVAEVSKADDISRDIPTRAVMSALVKAVIQIRSHPRH